MKLARSVRSLLLIACLTMPAAAIASPVGAQQNLPRTAGEEQLLRTLTVTGEGKQSIATTLTQVQLGVEVQEKTAQAAQQEAAKRSSAVVEFLRSRNVDKLQTAGISLSPRYDYSNNRQQIIGYTATNTVSFRLPTERAGDLLDQAVAVGATRIDSVSFVADDAAIETARQQAIRAAVQNAQAQAEATLGSLGLKQQEIVGIQVNNAAPPPPILYRRAAAMEASNAAAPSTPIVGGEQEVQASVTLQIRY
jgi:uncharacterized protein YggE